MVEGRRERKFLVDGFELAVLRHRLSRVLRPDPHAGPDGTYHVRSLYFDDLQDSALRDKRSGVRDRHKWRLRIYDRSAGRIRLECKIKRDALVVKRAAVIRREVADALIAGGGVHSPQPLVREFAVQQRAFGLRPVVVVDYVREAFVHRAGRVRVTLDRKLRSGGLRLRLFDPSLPVVPIFGGPRRTILEVKSTGLLPEHVRMMLPASIGPARALSKYVLCRVAPEPP